MGLVAGLNFYPQVEIRKGWGRNVEKKDNEQCASIAAQMRPTWLVERLKCIATAYAVSMNSSGMLTRSSIAWSFKPKRWRSIAFPRIACIEGRVGESLSSIKVSNAINFGGTGNISKYLSSLQLGIAFRSNSQSCFKRLTMKHPSGTNLTVPAHVLVV